MLDYLLYFHVYKCKKAPLLDVLRACSGIRDVTYKRDTVNILDCILLDETANPDYLVVNKGKGDWYSIECNSLKKAHEWGQVISAELSTIFIQTLHVSSIDYSYLLVYDRGAMVREIEGAGDCPDPVINKGVFFASEKLMDRAGELVMFDLDCMAGFCLEVGIDLTCLQRQVRSAVLDQGRSGAVRDRYAGERKK